MRISNEKTVGTLYPCRGTSVQFHAAFVILGKRYSGFGNRLGANRATLKPPDSYPDA
jgi:hypothetical protein